MKVLKHYTNKQSLLIASNNRSTLKIYGYVILHTKEVGNILLTHTDRDGNFTLDIGKVVDLFLNNHCNATLTCFPAKHYIQEPELAELLNILLPDINEIIAFNPVSDYPDIQLSIKD